MSLTTDRNDKGINKPKANGQNESYLILSEEERAKGFMRPVRQTYVHKTCKTSTKMAVELAETYATNPKFYGSTFCVGCRAHYPVSEFTWEGTQEEVGS